MALGLGQERNWNDDHRCWTSELEESLEVSTLILLCFLSLRGVTGLGSLNTCGCYLHSKGDTQMFNINIF